MLPNLTKVDGHGLTSLSVMQQRRYAAIDAWKDLQGITLTMTADFVSHRHIVDFVISGVCEESLCETGSPLL